MNERLIADYCSLACREPSRLVGLEREKTSKCNYISISLSLSLSAGSSTCVRSFFCTDVHRIEFEEILQLQQSPNSYFSSILY